MELLLQRDVFTLQSTTARLFVNGVFECFVLEDRDRGLKQSMPIAELLAQKVKGQTCIPAGTYEVRLSFSNRFQRELPILLQVPGFEGVRIHSGNVAADTEGCLLPGVARGTNKVVNSRMAFKYLMTQIKRAIRAGEKVTITVE